MSGPVNKNNGIIIQCTEKAYNEMKIKAMIDWNKILIPMVINFSTSIRTFCNFPSVSPER